MDFDLDKEWNDFNLSEELDEESDKEQTELEEELEAPEPSELHISTNSKMAYLSVNNIDLKIFWEIPIISYSQPFEGVVKKQMKFTSNCKEELEIISDKLKKYEYFKETIIKSTSNNTFKDIRKVSVGISKKDFDGNNSSHAFYNCFVIYLRIFIRGLFKEFHVKIFNTGKIEIPGIQHEGDFNILLDKVIEILQPYINDKLGYSEKDDIILTNSNFNCNYYIDRTKLNDILGKKYNMDSIYDPCSYPGVQLKYVCEDDEDEDEDANKYNRISFMIFRTGNVLIGGRINRSTLNKGYKLITNILKNEFNNIHQSGKIIKPDKHRKKRLKKILIKMK
tara:strand:- start:1576 stop:2583 length:1008 start_codon:yes stop_codon:yes gene_type:complete